MNAEVAGLGTGQINVFCSDDAIEEEEWITPEDLAAIRQRFDGVDRVTPNDGASGNTTTGKGEFTVQLNGGTEDMRKSMNYNIKRGSYFTQTDVEEGNCVCVLTDNDAKRLFGLDDVVGMDIELTINNIAGSYRIVA